MFSVQAFDAAVLYTSLDTYQVLIMHSYAQYFILGEYATTLSA